jgi:hypothetical protein
MMRIRQCYPECTVLLAAGSCTDHLQTVQLSIPVALGPLIGAIAGGNAAVLKPSEMTPHSSVVIQEIIEAALESSC